MGYCRVSEVFAQIDATLSVIMGVHQSIGMKGIVLFGSDEQKSRFLPELCSGEKLAGFALTEPEAGSDVHGMHTRAEREADGAWRLNGHKHYIGNGDKGSVFVTFAATEIDGERRHTAFIVEKGMEGFEVGKRFDTMGLRGNDLRELFFNDVRVPPENVLGEPGDGFKIAMHILNNGRMSLGTGAGGRVEDPARPDHRPREGAQAVRAPAGATSSWSRTRSAGWSPTCSGSSRWPISPAAWSTRACPTTRWSRRS